MTTKKKQNLKMVDFYEKYKYDKNIIGKSKSWFQSEMVKIERKRLTPPKLIANNGYGLHKSKMAIGKMYCFLYDAKMKKELPYSDKFPRIFIFNAPDTHFWGINLHYMHPFHRAQLMDGLLKFASDDKLTSQTKMKFTWQTIAGFSRTRFAKPAVKQYLYTQVKSPFTEIPAFDWFSALMINPARFNVPQEQVWRDSLRISRDWK